MNAPASPAPAFRARNLLGVLAFLMRSRGSVALAVGLLLVNIGLEMALRQVCHAHLLRKYVGFSEQRREVKDGFFVKFARGHSIFVENTSQLERLGLAAEGGLIDMATGLPVQPNAGVPSLMDRPAPVDGITQRATGVDGARSGSVL